MKVFLNLLLTYLLLPHSEGLLHFGKELKYEATSDNLDQPLILTPWIEQGKIKEAQKAALVKNKDFGNQTSYSGYFTVNKEYDSNMFFWYFPCPDPSAPVLLWLQGGPGSSSLFGVFMENGPFVVSKNLELKFRNTSWTKVHHMIYIDNPVGTGFSFTDFGGYLTDEVQIGNQLYEALIQFFKMFPHLQRNEFYVSGESYGGKYVPAVSYAIHTKNPSAKLKINLKGIAIGNGLSDPAHQSNYADLLYQLGLMDANECREQKQLEEEQIKRMKQNKSASVPFPLVDVCIYNFLKDKNFEVNLLSPLFPEFLNLKEIRQALHVGNTPYHLLSAIVHALLFGDMSKSVAPWISELLNHYRVMTYNGQLDIIVAYVLTENYLQHLNFSGAQEYKTAERHLWYVDKELAGYVKQAGNLTEVMVRNAGHTVPADQPNWALDLITRFTRNLPLY